MKRSEFLAVQAEFEEEEKWWKALKIGQSVYESGMEGDYFEIVIEEINIEERYIRGRDLSQGGKKVKITVFQTAEDIKEVFNIEFVKQ